jgi:hypothetical protein
MPASGRHEPAVQMTTQGGFFAAESADAKWLYYSRIDLQRVMGVWRKLLTGDGARPVQADDAGQMVAPLEYASTATWVLSERNIFYATPGDSGSPAALWAFDLQTRRKRMIHNSGELLLGRGLALSPGGKSLYFVQLDRWQSNVIVADYEIVK